MSLSHQAVCTPQPQEDIRHQKQLAPLKLRVDHQDSPSYLQHACSFLCCLLFSLLLLAVQSYSVGWAYGNIQKNATGLRMHFRN